MRTLHKFLHTLSHRILDKWHHNKCNFSFMHKWKQLTLAHYILTVLLHTIQWHIHTYTRMNQSERKMEHIHVRNQFNCILKQFNVCFLPHCQRNILSPDISYWWHNTSTWIRSILRPKREEKWKRQTNALHLSTKEHECDIYSTCIWQLHVVRRRIHTHFYSSNIRTQCKIQKKHMIINFTFKWSVCKACRKEEREKRLFVMFSVTW